MGNNCCLFVEHPGQGNHSFLPGGISHCHCNSENIGNITTWKNDYDILSENVRLQEKYIKVTCKINT